MVSTASQQQATVERLIRARICELVTPWAAWNRRSWDLGTVLALREAHEASAWVSRRVLSESSLGWFLRASLQPRLGQDMALGDSQVKQQLEQTLKSSLTTRSKQRTLAQLVELIEDDYLGRWRDYVRKLAIEKPGQLNVERTSRYIACHMLDGGFHMDNLRKIIPAAEGSTPDLADLIDYLNDLDQVGTREYKILIVLNKIPALKVAERSASWVPLNTIQEHIHPLRDKIDKVVRNEELWDRNTIGGGLKFTVTARDKESAAEEAAEVFARLVNRVRYLRGSESELSASPFVVVDNLHIIKLRRPSRAASLQTLKNEGLLYDLSETEDGRLSQLDEAFELASALNGGPPSAAVAGGWAALESLLSEGEDASDREVGKGALAADRAAALVVSHWPRSELTVLSHRAKNVAPRLAAQLGRYPDQNRERCRVITQWLRSGGDLEFTDDTDKAALARMQEVIDSPKQVINRVNKYVCGSMRRLYRQRNIILHGGSIQSVALRSTLRTTAPLVGAALDSIAYGFFKNDQTPLDSAARAQLALRLIGDPDGWDLHELNRATG